MGVHLFPPFSRVIDAVPVEAIAAVVEREAQMLADDLAHGRTVLDDEARSILSFNHFLEAMRGGVQIPSVVFPMTNTSFYRKTTERLIEAGKLPGSARERFDAIFSRPALKVLGFTA